MAKKLYFRFGSMNSGKSLLIQTVAFNYEERGGRVVVAKPLIDTKSSKVTSRLGLEREVDWPVDATTSFLELFLKDKEAHRSRLKCIIVDEAQFLEPRQVDELFNITLFHDTPVIAYGLRTDFQTNTFPGSQRLLEIAHSLEELKNICRCGAKALFNARRIDGEFVGAGAQVAIDGEVDYESLCGRCFSKHVGDITTISNGGLKS